MVEEKRWAVVRADCVDHLRTLPENSIDSVVCDPPYGLEFMGKEWDRLDVGPAGTVVDPSTQGGYQDGNGGNAYSRSRVRYGHPSTAGTVGAGGSVPPSPVEANQRFGDRMRVNFGSRANLKCGKCGHWRFSGTPCTCPEPEFPNLKGFDSNVMQEWHYRWAVEVFRVLKPGGHLLAFGGTRTYHRLASAIEDAGFEIRDTIQTVYANGFPKSHNISRAFVERAGLLEERGSMPVSPAGGTNLSMGTFSGRKSADNPISQEAKDWSGYGTALKPAHEPVVIARKPLIGTVVENVRKFGTGALNIDATRVVSSDPNPSPSRLAGLGTTDASYNSPRNLFRSQHHHDLEMWRRERPGELIGRWPPNLVLIHDLRCVRSGTKTVTGNSHYPSQDKEIQRQEGQPFHGFGFNPPGGIGFAVRSEEVESWSCVEGCPVLDLDRQSGVLKSGEAPGGLVRNESAVPAIYGNGKGLTGPDAPVGSVYGDQGGASRFFPQFGWEDEERSFVYCPKAPRSEREAGLEDFKPTTAAERTGWVEGSAGLVMVDEDGEDKANPYAGNSTGNAVKNAHPTVKAIALMRWLIRLVTPPGGTVLDPFAGSGTTGAAAVIEKMRFIGIERDPNYADIAEARIAYWERQPVYEASRVSLQRDPAKAITAGVPSLDEEW